jgi:LmbE family N-acetylglucosaminyl deacetylase
MEFRQALLTARLGNKAVHQLGLADQESSLAMADLAHLLTAILDQLRPEIVLTHPYEGGHPDHDATAFGVHAASALLQQFHNWKPILLEMTSYHNRSGRMESGEFIPRADAPATTFVLTESEIQFKRRLFECFATQRRVLAGFRIEYERFRAAPVYDFLEPPHDGILYYEMFNWGMTGARWRTLAEQALMKLGLAKPVPVGLGGGGEYVNCS